MNHFRTVRDDHSFNQASGSVGGAVTRVTRGGVFQGIGPVTLMQAVALAGGVDEEKNERRTAAAAAFDLVSIRRGEMDDPWVYAGDIIVVVDRSSIRNQKQLFRAFPLLSISIQFCKGCLLAARSDAAAALFAAADFHDDTLRTSPPETAIGVLFDEGGAAADSFSR